MTPKVSVIVPVRERTHLAAALASIQNQNMDDTSEVIVVDDREGAGAAAARNAGATVATGELLAFLDADDQWTAGSLRPRIDFLDRHPDVGMVFSDMAEFDDKGWVSASFLRKKAWRGPFDAAAVLADAVVPLLRENFVPLPTIVMRRSFFAELGGFDPALRVAEDWDLWLRASRRRPVGLVPIVALHRRLHPGNISRDPVRVATADIAVLRKFLRDTSGLSPRAVRFARRKLAWRYQTCSFGFQRIGDWRAAGRVALRSIAADPSGPTLASCVRLLARGWLGDSKPWANVVDPGWEAVR